MWTIRELKTQAKKSFMRNYSKAAFAALILVIIFNASTYFDGLTNTDDSNSVNAVSSVNKVSDSTGLGTLSGLFSGSKKTMSDDYFSNDNTSALESESAAESESAKAGETAQSGETAQAGETAADSESAAAAETVFPGLTYEDAETMSFAEIMNRYSAYMNSIFSSIDWGKTIPISLFWLLFQIFIADIFKIGGCSFYIINSDEKAKLGNILHGFRDGRYIRNVITMFCMELKILLWTMLFYIPGVVKSLEYRMVPYLLADNPEIDRKEAFRISKEMMQGEKWHAFLLDCSFILWMFADYICYGMIGIVYYNPYKYSTNAQLYLKLKELKGYGNPDVNDAQDWTKTQTFVEI